jgi:hypothetical protein
MTTSVEPTCCSCCVIQDEPVPAAVEQKAGTPRMSGMSRLVLAAASLALGLLFVLPLWHIALKAPQYPEGLGLYIAINRIEGAAPQDLNSINNLNHYIGMKQISPDDIPELRYMPWLVLGLMAPALGSHSWEGGACSTVGSHCSSSAWDWASPISTGGGTNTATTWILRQSSGSRA